MNLPFLRALSRGSPPPSPHRRGFYLVKKGFTRVEHSAEIPVEPRVRLNLILGRAGRVQPPSDPVSPSSSSSFPPLVRIIRNNSSYLSSVSACYTARACVQARTENEATEEMSYRAWRFSRICSSATDRLFRASRSWQTVVAQGAVRENTAKKFSSENRCDVDGGDVRGRWYKVRTIFWRSSCPPCGRLAPFTGP